MEKDTFNILVIDNNYGMDWESFFQKKILKNGKKIEIYQSGWKDIIVQSSTEKGCIVKLLEKEQPLLKKQKNDQIFRVDFILSRNFFADLHGASFTNILHAFQFCDIPSINSLDSLYNCQKPIVTGKLLKIQKKLGKKEFPIINQTFYPNLPSSHDYDLIPQEKFPVVIKMGTVHAGFGKIKLNKEDDMKDFQSTTILTTHYYMAENLLDVDYDLRLQRIGGLDGTKKSSRIYKRSSDNEWKKNWGDVKYEDYPFDEKSEELKKKYMNWMDIVQENLSLDMFTIDVLRLKNGEDVILELNDSSMGLMYQHEKEDNLLIRDLVMEKINSLNN